MHGRVLLARKLSKAEEVALVKRRERRAWADYATACRNAEPYEYEHLECTAWRRLCTALHDLDRLPVSEDSRKERESPASNP